VAHALVSPVTRVFILSAAIAFLALAGALLQDGKKKEQLGSAWTHWEEHTSYWPRLRRLHRAGAVAWIGGLVLWLAACWAHLPLAGIPAGVWRWLG
jgi:NnrU protein